ncbi:MAG TPA: putative baseplate assembly protein, partial [Pyrinomonadaceae bacterium]|nr:putative baseplate assembly protein [Pyrinomonadaceae bacterium]
GYEIFEPLVEDKNKEIKFYKSHNEIKFYTWGDAECCLPRGATRATLLDEWKEVSMPPAPQAPMRQSPKQQAEKGETTEGERPNYQRSLHLQKGDVLIFEEILGAKTGDPADADPKRRCAVRLTRVEQIEDPLTKTPVVEIEWAQADNLPFALCLSARLSSPDCRVIENISVARGNVILVDHGEQVWVLDKEGKRIFLEKVEGIVPTAETVGECLCEGSTVEFTDIPGKFRFALKKSPLTYSQKISRQSSAYECMKQDPRTALPNAKLYGEPSNIDEESADFFEKPKTVWHPKFDLLASDADERGFVVEIDNEGRAHIRFSDGECGRMPEAGTSFAAQYRIGNGKRGNVGAETIKYMVTRVSTSGSMLRPRNPMPAEGGAEAEPISEVKLFAPRAFRKKPERAITADDYAQVAELNEDVQRAAASLRWTGSWHEARVAVDPFGAEVLSEKLRRKSKGSLYRYRRIGHDLTVTQARYVPLDLRFEVCVAPYYLRGHIEAALREVFGNHIYANGRRGFFHPDNLTFGGGIYLSGLVAAAQAVEGVVSARVTKLQRLFESANNEIANGVLPLANNEIARLDNNPNFPERGRLNFAMTGGR